MENQFPFGIDPRKNYTQDEAAKDVLGCQPCTLEAQRSRGVGPRFVKIGRLVRYPGQYLIEYMESRTVQNTQTFGRGGGVV